MSRQSAPVGTNQPSNATQKEVEVDIVFDGGKDQLYSTLDAITGEVILKHESGTSVNELTLSLEGACTTRVENRSETSGPATGRASGRHYFLKLQHPVDASLLPGSPVEDGKTQIRVPFTFVVPEHLLPGACDHHTNDNNVKLAHLLLPPTLEADHYVRDVQIARISYAIRVWCSSVKISTSTVSKEGRFFGIRILPKRDEEPPLEVYDDQHDYCLRRTVPVRSTFGKVLGELMAETAQPSCLKWDSRLDEQESVETTVRFSFIPAKSDDLPPEITSIFCKLVEHTSYAATPFEELPRSGKSYTKMALHGSYVEYLSISAGSVSNILWKEHAAASSSTFTDATPSDSLLSKSQGMPCFTTSIVVPLRVPKTVSVKGIKGFSPSFHSCLVSRTHAVEFEIHLKTNSAVMLTTNTTVNLTAPVQLVTKSTRETMAPPILPVATSVEIDRVLSFEDDMQIPEYEEVPGEIARRASQAGVLPDYALDANPASRQNYTAPANRHSVSTTYEVPEQEWQNINTAAKWVYRKAKAFHERRSSKG